jgi:hypothetical protein
MRGCTTPGENIGGRKTTVETGRSKTGLLTDYDRRAAKSPKTKAEPEFADGKENKFGVRERQGAARATRKASRNNPEKELRSTEHFNGE